MLEKKQIAGHFQSHSLLFSISFVSVFIAAILTFLSAFGTKISNVWLDATYLLFAIYIAQIFLIIGAYRSFRSSLKNLIRESKNEIALNEIDVFTGALRRRFFLEELKSILKKNQSGNVGYMLLDMDNLKIINDTYGHASGDKALKQLFLLLRTLMPEAIIGRLGGDEFAVLIPEVESRNALTSCASKIINAFNAADMIEGTQTHFSATIGFAMAPEDGDNAETLTKSADTALYIGKQSGRGKAVGFDKEMVADETYRRFIERELRSALIFGHLDVHYQPIVDIQGQHRGCYEALVRWNHCWRGTISPADFIPVAERSTLIDRLGEWVLDRACRDMATLGATSMSVNVSLVQLRRPEFAERFLGILARHHVIPEKLIVEITESIELTTSGREMANIHELTVAGVKIALDDFGSGATSLEYLQQLKFDAIKIDRKYTGNITSNAVSMALIAAISSIGRALNIKVVAEGVETEAQFKLLQAAGCTHCQGYFFGKPQSLEHRFDGYISAINVGYSANIPRKDVMIHPH